MVGRFVFTLCSLKPDNDIVLSFVLSYVLSFVLSLVLSFVLSFVLSSVLSFVLSFVLLFVLPFVLSFMLSFVLSFVLLFVLPFVRLFVLGASILGSTGFRWVPLSPQPAMLISYVVNCLVAHAYPVPRLALSRRCNCSTHARNMSTIA